MDLVLNANFLDAFMRDKVLTLIKHQIDASGSKLILASHRIEEMNIFTERVLMLHEGKLLADIPIEDLKLAIEVCPVIIEYETQNNSLKPKKAIQEPAKGNIPFTPAINWNTCLKSECGMCKNVVSDPSFIDFDDPHEIEIELMNKNV